MWILGFMFMVKAVSSGGEVTLPDFLAGTAIYVATDGIWEDPGNWGGAADPGFNGGLPTRQQDCRIGGTKTVTVTTQQVIGHAQVGFYVNEDAAIVADGSSADLVTLSKMRLADFYSYDAGVGKAFLWLKNGAKVRGNDLAIGPLKDRLNSTSALSEGTAKVSSGRLAYRRILIAAGVEAKGTLEIDGSGADSIEALDYLLVSTWETVSSSDGNTYATLKFNIDSQGVTPITIHNSASGNGLRLDENNPASMEHKIIRTLEVFVKDGNEPPSGNIILVDCSRSIAGYFTGLKPGADDLTVYATSTSGKEYRWTLTYNGGTDGNDLVLENPQRKDGGSWVSYTTGGSQKNFTLEPTIWNFPPPPSVTFEGKQKAFPTAEGFGGYSKGGRGGTVYHVTTLADSGPGSLREAVEANEPRTIVFDVGGTIDLQSKLIVRDPYLTIAGQTAPGEGITVTGDNFGIFSTHDVVVRYMRFRPTHSAPTGDALSIYSAYNCIIDHCSLSWSTDEVLSITGSADLCTVQWCIIAEALNFEGHAYMSILGGERSTWHHNLMVHFSNRVPRFLGFCRVDWRDNVVYNWKGSGYGEFADVNFVNNWYKMGANTGSSYNQFHDGKTLVRENAIFIEHNVMAFRNAGSLTRILDNTISDNPQDGATGAGDNWVGMKVMDVTSRASTASEALSRPYTLNDDTYALHALAIVPPYAGNNKNNGVDVRDATDARIIDEFRYGNGAIKDYPPGDTPIIDYFGSTPTDSTNDTDRDGMPNSWEYARTDPPSNTSLEPHMDADGDGYTNLEEYLNSLVTANH